MNDELLSGRRVLVIEDEMLVLMTLEDMLADLGCTSLAVAGNLDKALRLIATQRFDLATLDVNLNGEPSYPAARALIQAGVPFAFSTGYGEHGVDEGYCDRPVLNKPFSGPQLVRVLAALLVDSHPPGAGRLGRLGVRIADA
jgi:CheY-like chemotaxis protein